MLAASGTSFALLLIRTNRHHVPRIRKDDTLETKTPTTLGTHSVSGCSPALSSHLCIPPSSYLASLQRGIPTPSFYGRPLTIRAWAKNLPLSLHSHRYRFSHSISLFAPHTVTPLTTLHIPPSIFSRVHPLVYGDNLTCKVTENSSLEVPNVKGAKTLGGTRNGRTKFGSKLAGFIWE